MLRITQQSSPDAARQYYASADYYAEGQELVGRWEGEGARMLGLEGPVTKQAFNALCENRDPRTGRAADAAHKRRPDGRLRFHLVASRSACRCFTP